MRKLLLVSGLLPCLLLVAGCPKKGDAADAAAEASADAVVDAAPADAAVAANTPAAKNSADVARFGSETAIANEAAPILTNGAIVRTTPTSGTVVATLAAGVVVTKIAEQKDWFLITFPDPKDPTATLMGWTYRNSFIVVTIVDAGIKDSGVKDAAVAVVDAGPVVPVCAANQQLVKMGVNPVCKKSCKADGECKTGPCSAAATLKGTTVKVCATDP